MKVVIPFDPKNPKTRLSGVFNADEREKFARAMLQDVLNAIRATQNAPIVLTTTQIDTNAKTLIDESPLNQSINSLLENSTPMSVAVVMADLALATPAALQRLFETEGDLVLARGVGGGTNGLVTRHTKFRVDYHGISYSDHYTAGKDIDASINEIDSYRLAMDIDEPRDLAEVLLHNDGHAAQWLRASGVKLVEKQGRVSVSRSSVHNQTFS